MCCDSLHNLQTWTSFVVIVLPQQLGSTSVLFAVIKEAPQCANLMLILSDWAICAVTSATVEKKNPPTDYLKIQYKGFLFFHIWHLTPQLIPQISSTCARKMSKFQPRDKNYINKREICSHWFNYAGVFSFQPCEHAAQSDLFPVAGSRLSLQRLRSSWLFDLRPAFFCLCICFEPKPSRDNRAAKENCSVQANRNDKSHNVASPTSSPAASLSSRQHVVQLPRAATGLPAEDRLTVKRIGRGVQVHLAFSVTHLIILETRLNSRIKAILLLTCCGRLEGGASSGFSAPETCDLWYGGILVCRLSSNSRTEEGLMKWGGNNLLECRPTTPHGISVKRAANINCGEQVVEAQSGNKQRKEKKMFPT